MNEYLFLFLPLAAAFALLWAVVHARHEARRFKWYEDSVKDEDE